MNSLKLILLLKFMDTQKHFQTVKKTLTIKEPMNFLSAEFLIIIMTRTISKIIS